MAGATQVLNQRIELPRCGFGTRVLRSGVGAPVLLLHGSPDSATEWKRVMQTLGEACACFAPDHPGLGHCDEPPPSFDYSHRAHEQYLDELVEALGLSQKLVVVVHDIGGVVGLPWVAKRAERVAGLVITNTVVFENFEWFSIGKAWGASSALGRAAAELRMWLIGLRGGALFRQVFGKVSPELPAADLERMTRELALDAKSKRASLRLFRQMIPSGYFEGMDAVVRELIATLPVRVVWGLPDPYIPARYADAFPGAKRDLVEGAGHWLAISAPERVAAAVRELL